VNHLILIPYFAGALFFWPVFSIAENPLTRFGQMMVACIFVGWGGYSICRSAERRRIEKAAAHRT